MKLYYIIMINQAQSNQTFPNLEVANRIHLTLPVINCTAERSFSALKIIKSENRTIMEDEKLNSLTFQRARCRKIYDKCSFSLPPLLPLSHKHRAPSYSRVSVSLNCKRTECAQKIFLFIDI